MCTEEFEKESKWDEEFKSQHESIVTGIFNWCILYAILLGGKNDTLMCSVDKSVSWT